MGEAENLLHIRMNSHRLDIDQRCLEKLVAQNFNSNETSFQKAKESHWIRTLCLLAPERLYLELQTYIIKRRKATSTQKLILKCLSY